MTPEQPEFRISDAEREEAIEALGTHMRDGRLDIDEYGDRTARVTAAKTRGELVTLFSDLPEPRPAMLREQLPAPPQPRESRRRVSRRHRPRPPGIGVMPIAIMVIIGLIGLTRGAMPMLLIPAALLLAGIAFSGRCWPGRR